VLVLDFVHMPDFRTVIDGVSGPHPGLNGNHARLLQDQAKNAPLLQKRGQTTVFPDHRIIFANP